MPAWFCRLIHLNLLTKNKIIFSCRGDTSPDPQSGEIDLQEDSAFTIVLVMNCHEATYVANRVIQLGRVVDTRSVYLPVTRHMRCTELVRLVKAKITEHFEVDESYPSTLQYAADSMAITLDEENCFTVMAALQRQVRQGQDAELIATLVAGPGKERLRLRK
nr:hypothetical protein CFP56_28591 [Quercus suber]